MKPLIPLLCAALLALARPAAAAEPNAMFLIRDTTRSADEVVAAVKAYVKSQDWVYVNDASLKGVVFVKFCVPEMARDIFAAGDHMAALLPCGSMAVYRKGGRTQISMLHPAYMNAIQPDPSLERAARTGLPLFNALLDAVAK